jgi:hypothetical protein
MGECLLFGQIKMLLDFIKKQGFKPQKNLGLAMQKTKIGIYDNSDFMCFIYDYSIVNQLCKWGNIQNKLINY